MRIYSHGIDKTLDEVEISLTTEQFNSFFDAINELSNNPLNRKQDLLYEIVDGDIKNDVEISNEITITRYNKESIGEFFGERNKMIILYDK